MGPAGVRGVYTQGDVERELDLRGGILRSLAEEGDETDAANQMAFMDFVVKPTLEALAIALPEAADIMLEHLSRNRGNMMNRPESRDEARVEGRQRPSAETTP